MKEFPSHLKPCNKDKFKQYRYSRNLAYMRKEIFELVLQGDENNYFDLDNFSHKYLITSERQQMLDVIMDELKLSGWNVKTSFAGTGLFIYSTDTPPSSCHEDKF